MRLVKKLYIIHCHGVYNSKHFTHKQKNAYIIYIATK